MGSPKLPPLRELHFGQLDAAYEAQKEPELLRDGFFDHRDAAYGIAAQETWLMLGPKGAGKTAVLEHLRLRWADRWDRFFTPWDLRSFPIADVTHVRTGQASGPARAQSAWEFLLLLRIVESLSNDEGARDSGEFRKLLRGLRRDGLLDGEWKTKVVEWTKASARFNLSLAEVGIEVANTETAGPLQLAAVLKSALSNVQTSSQHVIALDGLDSFFFDTESQWVSLAGLMNAIHSINLLLRSRGLRISVVAALRSDVFDMTPSPDANKLKPHCAYLDWSAGGIGKDNALWRLVTEKASISRPAITNLVSQYLTTPVFVGRHRQRRFEMPEFLLDHTRLLPRDLVALLGYVQRSHPGSTSVTERNAKDAVQAYSEEYFVGEMFDNLAGVLPAEKTPAVPVFRDALMTLQSRFFTFDDVQGEIESEFDASETKALLRQMFTTGGIGIRTKGRSVDHTDFVFRKAVGAAFTLRHGFLLHNALTRAWNVPWI